jgi:NAD(P)H-dependent FMN reductase
MSKLKIGIVIGSTRPNRFADIPTQWIKSLADARDDIEAEILDLRDFPLPFFDETISPAYGPSNSDVAQAWQRRIDAFDGFIFIAAEYNHGPTAVLKNAIDYAFNEWARKPVTFVGYGGVGGARAVEQLRLHAVEVQMAPTRVAVHILWPDYMAVRQGKPLAELDHLNQSAAQVLDQLAWWGRALKTARETEKNSGEADRGAVAKAAA